MSVFVDTSALLTLFDRHDPRLSEASQIWERLIDDDEQLITTNYVLLEMNALLQRRFGMNALRDFQEVFVPLLKVIWVDKELHNGALAAEQVANRRRLSLVDCLSFTICRRFGVKQVFAFDPHFAEQGFEALQ